MTAEFPPYIYTGDRPMRAILLILGWYYGDIFHGETFIWPGQPRTPEERMIWPEKFEARWPVPITDPEIIGGGSGGFFDDAVQEDVRLRKTAGERVRRERQRKSDKATLKKLLRTFRMN
jgi:hypothetical protein